MGAEITSQSFGLSEPETSTTTHKVLGVEQKLLDGVETQVYRISEHNENDGDIDCNDIDCIADSACIEEICDDGLDEDGDGAIDCFDSDCDNAPECVEVICDDGLDNEPDGLTDCSDPDCDFAPNCRELTCDDGHAYWLVYPETHRNAPKIRAFRRWLRTETAASPL